MWTDITRAHHARVGLALPSDLTDAEWAVIAPFVPARRRLGHPARWSLRRIVEALLYLLRGGLPWRIADPRPVLFQDRVNDPGYDETWVEGMVVLHNPHARRPLDPALLPGATHEFLEPDGRIMSLLPERPIYFSQTMITLEGDPGPASEDEAIAAAS